MSLAHALVQVLDVDGCVIGWALRTVGDGAAAGPLPAGTNNIGDVDVLTLPALPAGTNNIGDVDVLTLPALSAGTNVIGVVGSPDIVVTVTPVIDTAIYAPLDLLFDSTEIANAVRVAGGTAILQSVTLLDKSDLAYPITLLFANSAIDFGVLNAAPNLSDALAESVIGWVPVSTYDFFDLGASKVASLRNLGLLLKAAEGSTSLYVAAVLGSNTPTYPLGNFVLQLGFLRS